MPDSDSAKDSGRREIGAALGAVAFGVSDLWVRYVGLGGVAAEPELRGYLGGDGELSDLQHDIVVHAMNERFAELGVERFIPYLGTR